MSNSRLVSHCYPHQPPAPALLPPSKHTTSTPHPACPHLPCSYCQDVNMPMDKTAQVLAHYARHRAADPKFASPFAYSAFQVT